MRALNRVPLLIVASFTITAAALWSGAERAAASVAAPSVVTGFGSPLDEAGATLNGSVNPNGSSVTDCHFEYGTSPSYGASAPCTQSVGGGSEPIAVSTGISSLHGGTIYHFRLAASNEAGPSLGEDQSFSTPKRPSVTTFTPIVPGSTTVGQGTTYATLQGSVAANGSAVTDCGFEYGTSPSFGSAAPCAQTVGSGSTPVAVSATVTSLQWGTVYWVKLVAANAGGTSDGGALQFLTASLLPTVFVPSPPPITGPYTFVYGPPEYTYDPPQSVPSPKTPPAMAKCLKLRGSHRSKCIAALNRSYGINPNDIGLYVSNCARRANASSTRASAASTSEKGWPAKQCLKMDKGPAGKHHTIVGVKGMHNWLLGGYGSDTIIGGNIGDVIWGDYQESGWPKHQTAIIHAGNGRNVIYANDTLNYVWTGTNPRTVVHAHASGISGVIHCGSSQQVMFLSVMSEKHFKLEGCGRISHYSVGY